MLRFKKYEDFTKEMCPCREQEEPNSRYWFCTFLPATSHMSAVMQMIEEKPDLCFEVTNENDPWQPLCVHKCWQGYKAYREQQTMEPFAESSI